MFWVSDDSCCLGCYGQEFIAEKTHAGRMVSEPADDGFFYRRFATAVVFHGAAFSLFRLFLLRLLRETCLSVRE